MSASVTRFIAGLNEQSVIALDDRESLELGSLRFSKSTAGWRVERRDARRPGVLFPDDLTLNGQPIREPTMLRDDDFIASRLDFCLFHEGPVARDGEIELAAIESHCDSPAWEVLADWLQDQGDPIGPIISEKRRVQTLQRALFVSDGTPFDVFDRGVMMTSDSLARFEVAESNGVVLKLTSRSQSLSDFAALMLVLQMRRCRFLRTLVIDADLRSRADLDSWMTLIETLPLPRWMQSISVGGRYGGAAPPDLHRTQFSRSLRQRCPRLQPEPLLNWTTRARLEVVEVPAGYLLEGLARGSSLEVHHGMVLEGTAGRAHVHLGPALVPLVRHYAFQVIADRWWLRASDLDEGGSAGNWEQLAKPISASIGGWKVRATHLLDGDFIELEPGVLLVFRLGPY